MQITIAGGCGDFGRSCFFVEGERHAFIVDAGTSTDGLDRMPDLTPAEIAGAEYLFITHSHRDHTGAIEYFENKGFRGPVLLTNQAFRQIHHKPENTMILDSTAPELELEPDFSFRWGRTGHCAGAVWYHISCEGKKLFFQATIVKTILFTCAMRYADFRPTWRLLMPPTERIPAERI